MPDPSPLLSPLAPAPNLTSGLVKRLTFEIESGKLAPGSRLPTEQVLINATGVSRTVVREAISALRADGLVITRQGVGAFVSPDARNRPFRIHADELQSINEVLKVFELRISIETEAAGFAAERRTKRHLGDIKRCLRLIDHEIELGETAADARLCFPQSDFRGGEQLVFRSILGISGKIHHSTPTNPARFGRSRSTPHLPETDSKGTFCDL